MRKKAPVSGTSEELTDLTTTQWQRLAQGWILDGEIRQLSTRTLEERQMVLEKLAWFFDQRRLTSCGTHELRSFLAYVARGHEDPAGRWGNPRNREPVKPRTLMAYYRVL